MAKAENIFFQSFSSIFETETLPKMFESEIFNTLFRDNINLHLSEKVQFQGGDVKIFKDQLAFQFDFNVQGTFAILIDRIGNFIDFEEPDDGASPVETNLGSSKSLVDTQIIRSRETQIVSTIADAINKQELAELLEKKSLLKINDQIEFKAGRFMTSNNNIVYKLIFSAEIELALMVDGMGRFLAFAKPHLSDNGQETKFESDDIKILEQSLDSIGNDSGEVIEHPELIDDIETELIDDIELDSIDDEITIEINDSRITRTSHLD
jgi:hypothetical protein